MTMRTTRYMRFFQIAVFLFASVLARSAFADDDAATTYVRQQQGHIMALLKKSAPSADVSAAMATIVDYDEMTRRAFGKYWTTLSDNPDTNTQRQIEVKGLLRQLIENNYRKNLKKTLGYETDFKNDNAAASEQHVKVKATKGTGHEAKTFHLEYVLRPDGSTFKAVDLVTERSSMTHNYYTQFDTMLSDPAKGYDYLVKKLQDAVSRSSS
jgi:ABC-type transporter MlaC component